MGKIHSFHLSPRDYLQSQLPDLPVVFFKPDTLSAQLSHFQNGFPGEVTYAVKANPDARVIKTLISGGMTGFDVASLAEIKDISHRAPKAVMHYNNPIRSVAEIQSAVEHGIRSFSVDRFGELNKLLDQFIPDSEISVRLKLPVTGAAYDFGDKFGADQQTCIALLKQIAASPHKASMTFHPGTQCEDPAAWAAYIKTCAQIAQTAGVSLYRLNVGGGFPAHRGRNAPDLAAIFQTIETAVRAAFPRSRPELLCEPGRALVADAMLLACRIKARSGNQLFLNDGIYGGLSECRDLGNVSRVYAVSALGQDFANDAQEFEIFGPTCDSLDRLPQKIELPRSVADGDYLVFESLGAYSASLATRFNGYGVYHRVTLGPPALSPDAQTYN